MKIEDAINKCGTELTFEKEGRFFFGSGVIIPCLSKSSSGGSIGHKGDRINDPDIYNIYTTAELLGNAGRGDIVSDGENEYYILCKDVYNCRPGSYIRAIARMCRKEGSD